ncbi:hypothetical protein PCE1_000561 [Barthelona sp. PCE]
MSADSWIIIRDISFENHKAALSEGLAFQLDLEVHNDLESYVDIKCCYIIGDKEYVFDEISLPEGIERGIYSIPIETEDFDFSENKFDLFDALGVIGLNIQMVYNEDMFASLGFLVSTRYFLDDEELTSMDINLPDELNFENMIRNITVDKSHCNYFPIEWNK